MNATGQETDFTFLRWLRWRHAGLVLVVTLLLEWMVGVYWFLQKQQLRTGLPSLFADWNGAQWITVLFEGLSVVLPVYMYAVVLVAIGCGVTRLANEQWAPPRGPIFWFVALSVLFTLIVSHAAHFLMTTGRW